MDVTIIIDGVKHKLVPDTHAHIDCNTNCSLRVFCDILGGICLCQLFQEDTHFEIEE